MKKRINLKSILLVLSLVAIAVTIFTGSVLAQSSTNYLKVKGKVLDGYSANIQVFEYSDVSDSWKKVDSKRNRSSYNLRLNPESEYRIYFTSNEGHMKVLHVESGFPGMWITALDVNFDQKNIKYAKLYRKANSSNYAVMVIHKDMSGSKITIGGNDRNVATIKN